MEAKQPKHIHKLDKEVLRSSGNEYVGSWVKNCKFVFIWSCKECPFVVKKEVQFYL